MNELDFLQQYVEAAKDSTNRSRHTLVLMFVASILIFAALWNSRQSSWGMSRLGAARALEDIFDQEDEQKEKEKEQKEKASVLRPVNGQPRYKAPDGLEELYSRQDTTGRNLYNSREAVFWAQQIRAEQVGNIQVPVVGFRFDVNDLGMLGGLTLSVLLMWAYYSLYHHANNLKLAFDFAREVGAEQLDQQGRNRLLYHTYQKLAMHQVFTIPPRPSSVRVAEPYRLKRLIRKAPKLLFLFPMLVQAGVVGHDWLTVSFGDRLNHRATMTVIISEWFSLFLISGLTLMGLLRWRKINREWQKTADSI
jgi:hypothetical protein